MRSEEMAVTIKDVAKKANVSISTVSRVINDSKPVSDEIKKRVFDVIEELGYKPNPVARSLVMKKSKLIGVIVPDLKNYYVGELLNAIEEIAKTYEYDIILCNSYGDLDQEKRYLELLESKQVEGIIFLTFQFEGVHKEFFEKTQLPVVMINREAPFEGIMTVSIDHYAAVKEMTSKLIEMGHKDILMIRNGETKDVFGPDHLRGYEDALKEAGLDIRKDRIVDGHFQRSVAYDLMKQVVDSGDLPTAVFATTDSMAVGASNCLMDHGYKVPDDVSIVGFYDTDLASIYRPKLSAVSHPIYDIGAIAIRMIIKYIDGHEIKDSQVRLPHGIVMRESSKEK